MSQFPNSLDDDTDIAPITNNITQIGSQVINALRGAVFNIEGSLGTGLWSDPALPYYGTASSLAAFLSVAFNPDGSIQPSVLASLPALNNIVNAQISPTAGIQESKLALAYYTTDLFSFISQVNLGVQQSLNFITNHGSKIEPHIQGINFNHFMPAILVASTSLGYFTNYLGSFRDNSNLYNLFADLNNDYIKHQVANGSSVSISGGQQSGGTVPPTNYAHNSSGIYLNPTNFSFVPQTTMDVQSFAEFVDSSNLLLLGSRIQTLYQNGIPRTAVSSSLLTPGQGQLVVPSTPCITYLLDGYLTYPVDDINHGDDIIQFTPPSTSITNNTFDALFAAVRPGDIITVNYGSFSVSSIVLEIKYLVSPDQTSKTYAVRINGKNLENSTTATASITRSLYNNDKAGVLALAQAASNISGVLPSLIAGNPRSAEVLSVNFSANLIDNNHYNLYLVVYPTGNPSTGVFALPAIDISGNQGATPGSYTLDLVVQNINNQFRTKGYNNRFLAFQYQGELGLKLADSINNISFSIVDGIINPTTGLYSQPLSAVSYPANAIGVPGVDLVDPTGLGPSGAAVSSPPYTTSYGSAFAAQVPTKIIPPLTLKTFYVDGAEAERFALQPLMTLDPFGDGYWPAVILARNVIAGVRVEVTYQVQLNLSTSGLQVGKTITVNPAIGSIASFIDSGRFFISNVQFNDCSACPSVNENIVSTNITVYDAIQSPTGTTPFASAPVGTAVNLYFSGDSVGFDADNASDAESVAPLKRFMEAYVDADGNTFSNERARMYIGNNIVSSGQFGYSFTGQVIGNPLSPAPLYGDASGTLTAFNLVNVSSKLRGYPYGTVDKINLQITAYNSATGNYDGYLCNFSVPTVSNMGPIISGKKGETTRFYDQTNVEFIDLLLPLASTSLTPGSYIDIQLFPTLDLDGDVFLLGTVQVNNSTNTLQCLTDQRQFGNVSEVQLSTSALQFISQSAQDTLQNGVIRGFDLVSSSFSTSSHLVSLSGGTALTNGQLNSFNPFLVNIPLVQDYNGGSPLPGLLWAVCVNEQADPQLIPLTDFNSAISPTNNPGRLLTLFNVSNSQTYAVDSTTFSSIINDRKDLTVLYLVNSQVTNSSTYSITVSDARKYATDTNANSLMVMTSDISQGNFHSFAALSSWATYNSSFQNQVLLRGNFVLDTDPELVGGVVYQGDGYDSSITLNAPILLSSSTTFQGCNFIVNTNTGFIIPSAGSNISFIDCTFRYAPPSGVSAGNLINSSFGAIYCSVASLQNISVRGCSFTTANISHPPFVSFEFNTVASSIAQSITVSDNQFYNTSAGDDLYAAVAFTSTQLASQPTEGLKLIGCNIQNNLCDKNQLIGLFGAMNSGGTISCAIVPIATKITGNLCGTISVLGAADNDRNYDTATDGFARSKGYGIEIAENTCRLICALSSTGTSVFYPSYYGGSQSFAINTCQTTIRNNSCSWIQLVPTFLSTTTIYAQNAALLIIDNSLRGYNSSYLTNFNGLGGNPVNILNAGIALTCNNVVSFAAQAIIRGNTIIQGSTLNSSQAIITYDYVNSMNIGINALIDGNLCSNIQSNGDMIQIYSTDLGSLTVSLTNNQFYRNITSIGSYINIDATTTHGVISNNFFDQTTTNGSSFVVVAGSSNFRGPISQNKNQTGFVSLDANQLNFVTANSSVSSHPIPSTDLSYNGTISGSGWELTIGATDQIAKAVNASLDTIIPVGAQLTYVMMGVNFAAGSGTNTIQFAIQTGISNTFSTANPQPVGGSFAGSLADVVANNGVFQSALYPSNTISLTSGPTQYCFLNVPAGVYAGSGSAIQFILDINLAASSVVAISPIMLRYQW